VQRWLFYAISERILPAFFPVYHEERMDTLAARKAIFQRIRQAGQGRRPDEARARADVAAYVQARACGPLPDLQAPDADSLRARFVAQAKAMADTVESVASMAAVPLAVAQYLAQHQLKGQVSGWQSLRSLPWQEAGIELACRKPLASDAVGITGVFCALAETGSLLLLSAPDAWSSTSLLPETHIAILPAARIVANMEAAFALVRSERGELPRNAQFISGPSRTGDIEQTIVLGAHGPYRVHVIVVDQD
jgi:L-lactate dehydrogenase complex protein LldG